MYLKENCVAQNEWLDRDHVRDGGTRAVFTYSRCFSKIYFSYYISSLVAALFFLNPKVDVVPEVQSPLSTFVMLRMWFRTPYID